MKSKYRVPHVNKKAPPMMMEDVPLGDDDVLLHIRSDEPYMLIQKDGTWPHVIACVLAYVMQRQDIFDICLQAWMREAMNQPDRWEMFKAVLRERVDLPVQNEKSTLTKGL